MWHSSVLGLAPCTALTTWLSSGQCFQPLSCHGKTWDSYWSGLVEKSGPGVSWQYLILVFPLLFCMFVWIIFCLLLHISPEFLVCLKSLWSTFCFTCFSCCAGLSWPDTICRLSGDTKLISQKDQEKSESTIAKAYQQLRKGTSYYFWNWNKQTKKKQ